MTKLAKYLKPFLPMLVAAILLLYGQAMCDLNLPNYMSNIVNVGIQQGGIEHAVPDAISQNGLTLMTTFMSEADGQTAQNAYRLVKGSDADAHGKRYDAAYPKAASEDIYVLGGVSAETRAELDRIFGLSAWTMITLVQDTAKNNGMAAEGEQNLTDVDMTKVYEMLPMLKFIPAKTLDDARAKAGDTDALMRKQGGVALTKAFYTELGMDLSALQTRYILKTGLLMLLIALLGGVATVCVSFLSSRIAAGAARDLRRDIFAKVESFSSAELDKFSTASLITRSSNDVMQVQMLLTMGIRMICYAPIMAIGGVIMAVNRSVSMSWIIAVACAVLLGVICVVMAIALPRFKIIQTLVDRLNLVSRENLTGMMVIRAFGTRDFEEKRFDKANDDLTRVNLFVNRVMVMMFPMMMLIMNGATLLVIWVGAHQIAQSAMQVGDMMAFMQYAMQIIMSFLMISMMFIFVPRAAISGARIAEVLGTEPSIRDPQSPKSFDGKSGYVEFENVSFRYGGAEEDALQDISFVAKPGETTAIIGATGSGKSTVANLIMRFYDVTRGRVLVDGMDVREVSQTDLRARIGFVPQKGMLISGTIESNIKFGAPDASDEDMRTAAEIAQASEFIDGKPDGYQDPIAQGGTNVSGGQKQRLSIARALAMNPHVLIFDDSFSALDFKTDAALRRALNQHTANSTIIVVAQRVSTIMNAQQILVLEKGRVVGQGTHRQLLKSCPEYIEIAETQLSKEELAQ